METLITMPVHEGRNVMEIGTPCRIISFGVAAGRCYVTIGHSPEYSSMTRLEFEVVFGRYGEAMTRAGDLHTTLYAPGYPVYVFVKHETVDDLLSRLEPSHA